MPTQMSNKNIYVHAYVIQVWLQVWSNTFQMTKKTLKVLTSKKMTNEVYHSTNPETIDV